VNGFTVAMLMIMAAVVAWAFTMAVASASHSRLRDETARAEQRMRKEIQHWKDEAERARSHAAQVTRDSATWAAGCKQGRDDVITVVPLLFAAHAQGKDAGACSQHAAQEVTKTA
jgi:Tfp pilus assembly protein FimT